MSNFSRGVVKKVTFEIEYPDGSRTVKDLGKPEDVGLIIFDESSLAADDTGLFNVSESDWKQNPSMIVFPRSQGRSADTEGIPFCTHNGCKE